MIEQVVLRRFQNSVLQQLLPMNVTIVLAPTHLKIDALEVQGQP